MSDERMTAAEFACWRHLLGLTLDEIADVLTNRHGEPLNGRTPRAWESGRFPIPTHINAAIAALVAEHDQLVRRYLDTEEIIGIVRDKTAETPRPRGWYVAAAARALHEDPDLMIDWA